MCTKNFVEFKEFSSIFILPFLIIHVAAICIPNYEIKNWTFDVQTPPPANLTQNLILLEDNETMIESWLQQRREDFDLTLLANPFIKNESACPHILEENDELRQFFLTCPISLLDNESTSIEFGKIFTGCYYFLMTNKQGKNWQHGPIFYETNYTYRNTKLKLEKDYKFKPEDAIANLELTVLLKVPLNCMDIRARMYQLKAESGDALDDIKNGSIPFSQECWIQRVGKNVTRGCRVSIFVTELTLEVYSVDKNDGWIAQMVWEKLQRGGGKYYFRITGYPDSCESLYGWDDIFTWRPIVEDIFVDLGHANGTSPSPLSTESNGLPWFYIAYGLAGFTVVAILFYWVSKYRILLNHMYQRGKDFVNPAKPVLLPDEEVSDQILLIYENGPPAFMSEMEVLRKYLQLNCSDYQVHDVYAIEEWYRIKELGASGWVEKLLRNGSKVIWIDTPQFRARFDDKNKDYSAGDFRDEAIPYAVAVAIDSFVNAITQYRRHFVAQVKGFEVQDRSNGPLQVISPHARYYIPDQVAVLCDHLRGSIKRVENTRKKDERSP